MSEGFFTGYRVDPDALSGAGSKFAEGPFLDGELLDEDRPGLDPERVKAIMRELGAMPMYFANPATGEVTDIGADDRPITPAEQSIQPQSHEEGEN